MVGNRFEMIMQKFSVFEMVALGVPSLKKSAEELATFGKSYFASDQRRSEMLIEHKVELDEVAKSLRLKGNKSQEDALRFATAFTLAVDSARRKLEMGPEDVVSANNVGESLIVANRRVLKAMESLGVEDTLLAGETEEIMDRNIALLLINSTIGMEEKL